MNRVLMLMLAATAGAQVSSTQTYAQKIDGDKPANVAASCGRDVQLFCASGGPDDKSPAKCLDRHKGSLTPECLDARQRSGKRWRDEKTWAELTPPTDGEQPRPEDDR